MKRDMLLRGSSRKPEASRQNLAATTATRFGKSNKNVQPLFEWNAKDGKEDPETGPPRFGYSFSRIAVHPPQAEPPVPAQSSFLLQFENNLSGMQSQTVAEGIHESARRHSPRQQVMRLHSSYGNQAALRMPSHVGSGIQARLTVNQPGDIFEQEADRMADQVMRMTEAPTVRRKCSAGGAEVTLQRKCAECEKEEEKRVLHRKNAAAGPQFAPPSVHQALNSPAQPLDWATRAFMEPRFGHDFSRVRVHADSTATQSALDVDALAYTVGEHVVFQAEKFNPGSREGKALIAHELAHVMQQEAPSSAHSTTLRRQPKDKDKDAVGMLPPTTAATAAPSTSTAAPPLSATPSVSQWNTDVPYVYFSLTDFYGSLYNPAGPYIYYSRLGPGRSENPNFSKDLYPAPARDTRTVSPSGWYAKPFDLQWFFKNAFYVDTAAAPLPKKYTKFDTAANITFTPSAGGKGFTLSLADNSPAYTPPGPSGALPLTTKQPFDFQQPIIGEGTLQWDATLQVAAPVANAPVAPAGVPVAIALSAPPECDTSVFKSDLEGMGASMQDSASLKIQVEIAKKGKRWTGNVKFPTGVRPPLETDHCETLTKALAVVVAVYLGLSPVKTIAPDPGVKFTASQRLKFETPKAKGT